MVKSNLKAIVIGKEKESEVDFGLSSVRSRTQQSQRYWVFEWKLAKNLVEYKKNDHKCCDFFSRIAPTRVYSFLFMLFCMSLINIVAYINTLLHTATAAVY